MIIQSEGHHDHFYVWAETTAHGLREAICACGHGIQVDPFAHVIEGGKIINKEA